MRHLILLFMYVGIGLFVLKHLFDYPSYFDAFFPGVSLGILATIVHLLIRQDKDQDEEEKEDHLN